MMLEKGISGDNAILSPDGEAVYIIKGTGLYRKTTQRNDYLSPLSCIPKRLQFVGEHAEILIIEDGQILAFDTRRNIWDFGNRENLVSVTLEILSMLNAPKKVVLCPHNNILRIYREEHVFDINIENVHRNAAISSNSGDYLVVHDARALTIFKYFEPKFALEGDNENSDIDECFEDNQ